jgi:hypothetical protein
MSGSKLFIHPVTFVNTNDASSPSDTNSSVLLAGGLAIKKSLRVNNKSFFSNGLDVANNTITSLGTCVNPTDSANKSYIDTSVLSFPLNASLYRNGSNILGISSFALGTGLLGGSGTSISVNPVQSLTSLNLSTPLSISSGGTSVSSVTTSPTPNAFAGWDTNENLNTMGLVLGNGYRKMYNYSGNIISSNVGNIQLLFTSASNTGFYAKVIANLANQTNSTYMSTLEFECNTQDGTVIRYWNFGVNGTTGSFPWNPVLTVGNSTISFQPMNQSIYLYSLFVEVYGNASLISVTQDSTIVYTTNY